MSVKLRELIRSVRACKTAADERAVIAKECALIRTSFKAAGREKGGNRVEKERGRNERGGGSGEGTSQGRGRTVGLQTNRPPRRDGLLATWSATVHFTTHIRPTARSDRSESPRRVRHWLRAWLLILTSLRLCVTCCGPVPSRPPFPLPTLVLACVCPCRQPLPSSQCRQASLHAHAWLPDALRSDGVREADRVAGLPGEANRLPRTHDPAR